MANIKNDSIQDLQKLRIEPLNKDEKLAIKNILKRKSVRYLYFVNIADEINIICFTEGSLRWSQEIFVRDCIFIGATGFWSLNVPGYKKWLYYALVTRYSFGDYPPIPVAEYITTTRCIFVMVWVPKKICPKKFLQQVFYIHFT